MKKKTKRKTQRIVSTVEEVPEDFIALKSFGNALPNASPPVLSTWQYNLIQSAWQAERITGVKVMRSLKDITGPVFVCRLEAAELLEENGQRISGRQVRIKKTQEPNLAGVIVQLKEIKAATTRQAEELENLIEQIETTETKAADLFTLTSN